MIGRHSGATAASRRRTDRGVTPVVAKTLEIGIALLFVTGLTTALFGGVVPDYRDAAAERVADRTLAGAATQLESALPPPATTVRVDHRIRLPETIRGSGYQIVAGESGSGAATLTLAHPTGGVGGTLRLAVPARVATVRGTWHSGERTSVVVRGGDGHLDVRLVSR